MRIAQLRLKFIDLVHYAVARRADGRCGAGGQSRTAEKGAIEIAVGQLDVGEVPVVGLVVVHLGRVPVGIAELVGPGRLVGDVGGREVGGVGFEQRDDLRMNLGLHIMIGDQRDDFVTLVASGEGVGRTDTKKK